MYPGLYLRASIWPAAATTFFAVLGSQHATVEDQTAFYLVAAACAMIAAIAPLRIRRKLRRRCDESARGPKSLSLTPEGMVIRWSMGETRLQWGNVTRLRETSRIFLLCMGPDTCYVIPKRVIGDEVAVSMIREFILTQIAPPTGGFPVVPKQ